MVSTLYTGEGLIAFIKGDGVALVHLVTSIGIHYGVSGVHRGLGGVEINSNTAGVQRRMVAKGVVGLLQGAGIGGQGSRV